VPQYKSIYLFLPVEVVIFDSTLIELLEVLQY